jgi:hypothetical protein
MDPKHLAYFDEPGPSLTLAVETEALRTTVVIPYLTHLELMRLDPEEVYATRTGSGR